MRDVKITMQCPGCEERIGFPGTEAGTVQECPECGGWVDVPELGRSTELRDPNYEESLRQYAESNRQLIEGARHLELNDRLFEKSSKSHEEWTRQLEQSARYQAVAEETIGRLASLVTRWEALTDALERVTRRLEGGSPHADHN